MTHLQNVVCVCVCGGGGGYGVCGCGGGEWGIEKKSVYYNKLEMTGQNNTML